MNQHTTTISPAGPARNHPPVAPAWAAISAAWTTQVQAITGRDDLTVLVTPGVGGGAPACITLDDGVIEVDADFVSVDPTRVDPTDVASRDLYPVGWGLLVHEIAHAEHTRWTPNPLEQVAAEMSTLLDEARIEGRRIATTPSDRKWLRASSLQLDLADLRAPDSRVGAATAAALLLARSDVGILTAHEVAPVRAAITKVIGRRQLGRLEQIWRRALRTADGDDRAMREWGRRWCRVLGLHTEIPFPIPADGAAVLADAVAGVLAVISAEVAAMIADARAALAEAQRRADERAEQLSQKQGRKAAADKVFGKHGAKLPPGQRGPARPPTEQELIDANRLTRALRKAAHREPTVNHKTSALPPGRLVPRAAMAEYVQRSLGQMPTAEPWKSTSRQVDPQPPLLVGITIDVSPSMDPFFGPAASIAWVIGQAVGRLPGGQSASTTFGSQARALTRPGHNRGTEVRELVGESSTRDFTLTVRALDHALGLTEAGNAARLLVMITDGEFYQREDIEGQRELDLLAQAGCGLLWIGPENSTPMTGTQVALLADASQAGEVITRAAVAALANR
ncbi:vWA domain-containing protein [Longispora sp. NPDC051575]|uniref:vWA domain-containing protein n=1 Tax=Longispora sp. NPDC051575 TaxID=3154943 RepID=UPI003416B726